MTMKWHQGAGGGNSEDEIEWKPETADSIIGTLTSKRTVNTKYGPTTILKVAKEDGQVYTVWCSRSGLKSLVEAHDDELIVGREIGIKTEGKTTLSDGNTFYPYEIGFGDFNQASAAAATADDYGEEPF